MPAARKANQAPKACTDLKKMLEDLGGITGENVHKLDRKDIKRGFSAFRDYISATGDASRDAEMKSAV